MKTRIIQTKVWKDDYFASLNRAEKLLFIYLITNERVNLTGMYELSDREIRFDTDLTDAELQEAKQTLSTGNKFYFLNGWVKIANYDKYNSYTGEKNEKAKENELKLIPIEIIQYGIDRVSTISDSLNNHKSEIKNHKSKTINHREYLISEEINQDLYTRFPRIQEKAIRKEVEKMNNYLDSHGKKYKDYRAFSRNWILSCEDKLPKKVQKIEDHPAINPEGLAKLRSITSGIGGAIKGAFDE